MHRLGAVFQTCYFKIKADGDHAGDPELNPHFYQNITILLLQSLTRN